MSCSDVGIRLLVVGERSGELGEVMERIAGFYDRYDVWLTPTLAREPLPIGVLNRPQGPGLAWWAFDCAFNPWNPVANIAGLPAMSVPLAWTSGGLPIGSLFTGRFGAEATLYRHAFSKRQLYERMVLFWSDHFNIDPSKGDAKWLKLADDRDVIRAHALGKFPDMLRASALSPAMLWYLDGRVNKKANDADKPNENYARELLELHTLGVHGGYTQKDVMEVARCLTGWTVQETHRSKLNLGSVEFKPFQHDRGEKVVLGTVIPEIPKQAKPEEIEKLMQSQQADFLIDMDLASKIINGEI